MEKAIVLVGMKDYKAATEFLAVVANELRANGIGVKMSSNVRMALQTPHAEIRFIYNPPYQNIDGLRADAVFGFSEYAGPLYPHLKPAARKRPDVGLVDWIVHHERTENAREQFPITYTFNDEQLKEALAKYSVNKIVVPQCVESAYKVSPGFSPFAAFIEGLGVKKSTFPEIQRVHFSGPVTCVIWGDGTKTLVRCGENDIPDPEKGLAMAIAKKVLGTNKTGSDYYDIFKQWLPKPEETEETVEVTHL